MPRCSGCPSPGNQRHFGSGAFEPYTVEGLIALSVTFSSSAEALMASLAPGSVRETPRIFSCTTDNVFDAVQGFFAVPLPGWSAADEVYG